MAARNVRIEFGLMTLAAKMEGAIDKPPSFSNLCQGQPGHEPHDPKPLKAPRRCDDCGEITDTTVLVKGIRQGKTYTIVEQAEIAEAKEKYTAEYKGALNLVPHPAREFLDATAPGESVHYLTPADKSGENVYQMLRRVVEEHPDVVLVSLYTPVSATSLYMLTVRNGVLVLEQRTRTQALKPAPSVGGEVTNEKLYKMLEGTVEAMLTPYNPDDYEDGYRNAIRDIAASRDAVTVSTGSGKTAAVVASDTEETLLAKLRLVAGAA